MEVICRTNLDDVGREEWPKELPALPREGDLITSGTLWNSSNVKGVRVTLRVCRVTFIPIKGFQFGYENRDKSTKWIPEIELSLHPGSGYLHISHFQDWYQWIQGHLATETYHQRVQRYRDEIAEEKERRRQHDFEMKMTLRNLGSNEKQEQ